MNDEKSTTCAQSNNEQALRTEALLMALRTPGLSGPSEVLDAANKYLNFVKDVK